MSAGAPRVGGPAEIARQVVSVGASRIRLAHRLLVASILFLSLVHGLLYATHMPPWGLIDEEQHLHYVQSLAEEGRMPIVHRDLLSPEIVQSLFSTKRWETVLHQQPPVSPLPSDMGLEAYSYEGYQPPLYYALLAPFYKVLPKDILVKLYAMRWLTVGLSLITVFVALRCTQDLYPNAAALPYAVALLIAVLPERTMAISRVNNDALVEVIAAVLVWAAIRAHRRGLDPWRSAFLGVLFGLGVISKVTMGAIAPILFYLLVAERSPRVIARNALPMGMGAAMFLLPLVARNLAVYGDLTGFSGFGNLMATVGGFQPPTLSLWSVARAIGQSFAHSWFIWWKGSSVGSNAFVRAVYVILFAITGASIRGLALRWSDGREVGRRRAPPFAALLLAMVPLYAILATISFLRGEVPVVQGRFLLPALLPGAMGLVLGLWRLRWGPWAYGTAVTLLAVMSGVLLFGNLLPHAYFWSATARGAVSLPRNGLSWSFVWAFGYPRFLADKPDVLAPLLSALAPLYVSSLVAVMASLRYWHKVHRDAAE